MKLRKILFLIPLFAVCLGLVACKGGDNDEQGQGEPQVQEKTYVGEYSEEFGKNKDVYTTKVKVTVLGDVIVKVEMAEDSHHYTKESSKWPETKWTEYEAQVLASFAGKSVSAILAAETNDVFEAISGATVTSNRIYAAVVEALKTIQE